MKKPGGFAFIFVLIFLSAADLVAQGIIRDDFKVNDDIPGAQQEASALAVGPLGNFVIVWQDSRNDGPDVFVQRFDASGEVMGVNCLVNNQLSGDQRCPSVAFGQSENLILVWQDTREGNRDIFAQMLAASGDTLGSNFKVNDDPGTKPQIEPEVDISTRIIVVWEDERWDAGDVFAQLLDLSCAPHYSNFKVNDDTNGFSQLRSDVASSVQGYFVVVWQDKREGNYDIYAQRFDSSGSTLGSNFKVNDDVGTSLQNFPKVAADSTGNFVVVWQDKRNGVEDIYAQAYDHSREKVGKNFRVNDDQGDAYQGHPDVGMGKMGNFVVTWVDKRNGDKDIFAQRYDSNLEPAGGNFRVNSDTGSAEQFDPAVAIAVKRIYFTWTDTRNGDSDIFAKVVEWNWTGLREDETRREASSSALLQNFPNPFNSSTSIRFTVHGIPKTTNTPIPASQKPVNGSQFTVNDPIHTTLKVYNIRGQLVRSSVDEYLPAGHYELTWNGKDNEGNKVATGLYFCRLKIGEYTETKKMLLLR